MSKPPPGDDLFGDDRDIWIGKAREAQYRLESVRNSYVGNKRKLLIDFAKILYDLGFHTKIESGAKVLDLFSGSAFVGYFFKSMGAAVWSNELLASSYLNACVLVEANKPTLSQDSLLEKYMAPVENLEPGVASKYIDIRFTESEAKVLDTFEANVKRLHGSMKDAIDLISHPLNFEMRLKNWPKSSMPFDQSFSEATVALVHYVLNRCYVGGRLNSGQVLAQLKHRIEHQRNQGCDMSFRDITPYHLSFDSGQHCIASRMDAIELLTKHKPDVDFIYIDPPYGGGQSDYAGMYEFFEEYLGFSRPIAAERFIKSKSYSESFKELLSALPQKPIWIFSYNDDSWANIEEIESTIKLFGRSQIIVKKVDYDYQYRSKEKTSGIEYVIIALP